jgi:hypothetical protein
VTDVQGKGGIWRRALCDECSCESEDLIRIQWYLPVTCQQNLPVHENRKNTDIKCTTPAAPVFDRAANEVRGVACLSRENDRSD